MLVQIYAIKSIEEMQMCIDAGVDRFGIVVGEKGKTPQELEVQTDESKDKESETSDKKEKTL